MEKLYDLLLKDIRFEEGLNACMNCGVCTAICPAAEFYNYDPRKIVDTVQTKDNYAIKELLKSETMKFSLGGAQDPLSRIGGFGAFSSGQSEMIRQAIDQKKELQGINKNTQQMARELANA